jgi:mannose-6-phosphate isomerase-like protein (cupin superfamily)
MSAGLEKVVSRGKTLAMIIRRDFGKKGIHFLTEPDEAFQLGVLNHPAGYKVKPHHHRRIRKENDRNLEFLFIVSGEIEARFYDDHKLVQTITLYRGDALLQLSGGHEFRMIRPTKIIEVKQGPYYGNEKEKEYLEE